MVAREGFRYAALLQQRHTKYGRIRGMVVGEGGRSTGVLLYYKKVIHKLFGTPAYHINVTLHQVIWK